MLIRRNTKQKNLIYQAVIDLKGHVSADDVYRKVSADNPSISRATVYRNLNILSDERKIRRIEPLSHLSEQRFDSLLLPHSHAICLKCGKMIDVHVEGEEFLDKKARPMESGFEFTHHELIFEGICMECRDKEKRYGT